MSETVQWRARTGSLSTSGMSDNNDHLMILYTKHKIFLWKPSCEIDS